MHYQGLIVSLAHLPSPLVARANEKKNSNLLMIKSQTVMKTIGMSAGSNARGRGAGAGGSKVKCRQFY